MSTGLDAGEAIGSMMDGMICEEEADTDDDTGRSTAMMMDEATIAFSFPLAPYERPITRVANNPHTNDQEHPLGILDIEEFVFAVETGTGRYGLLRVRTNQFMPIPVARDHTLAFPAAEEMKPNGRYLPVPSVGYTDHNG